MQRRPTVGPGSQWPSFGNVSLMTFGDFGDSGVSFVATVAGRYTRRGGARLSVQEEALLVPTRDNHEVPPMQRRSTVGPGSQKAPFRERPLVLW